MQSRFFDAPVRRTHDALEDAMQAAGFLLYESSDTRIRGERVVNRTVILGLPKGDEMVIGRLESARREEKSGTLVHIETLRQGGKTGEPKQSWSTAILDGTGCLLTTLVGSGRLPSQSTAASSTSTTGARSVLATLWMIDQTTFDMMAASYEGLAHGQSAPAALRQAKLHMLQQRVRMGKTDVSLAHPFFWAPFKLVGTPAR